MLEPRENEVAVAVRTPGAGLPARPRLLGPVLVVLAVVLLLGGVVVSLLHRPAVVPQRRLHPGLHDGSDHAAAAVRRLRPAHGRAGRRQRLHRLPRAAAVPADVARAAEPRALPGRRRAVPAQHPAASAAASSACSPGCRPRPAGRPGCCGATARRSASRTRSSAATSRTSPSPTRSSASCWASCSRRWCCRCIAAAVVHYLFGGVRLQTVGEKVSPAARAHLSVLVGLIVLLKAFAYYLDRYGLAFSSRGFVNGPGFTDVNAVLPAKNILIGIALICALLFFANIVVRNILLPAGALGAAGRQRRRHRRRLPGLHPAVPGQAERGPARAAVHPAQHRGDPRGVRHRRRRGHATTRPRRTPTPEQLRARGLAGRERPAARPERARADLRAAAAPHVLLRRQQLARHRPLRGRRRAAGLRRRGARGADRQPRRATSAAGSTSGSAYTHGNGLIAAPADRVDAEGRPQLRRPRRRGQPGRSSTSRASTSASCRRATRSSTPTRPRSTGPSAASTAADADGDARPTPTAGDLQLRRRRRRPAVEHSATSCCTR